MDSNLNSDRDKTRQTGAGLRLRSSHNGPVNNKTTANTEKMSNVGLDDGLGAPRPRPRRTLTPRPESASEPRPRLRSKSVGLGLGLSVRKPSSHTSYSMEQQISPIKNEPKDDSNEIHPPSVSSRRLRPRPRSYHRSMQNTSKQDLSEDVGFLEHQISHIKKEPKDDSNEIHPPSVSSRRLRPRPRSYHQSMQNTSKQEDLSEDVGFLEHQISHIKKEPKDDSNEIHPPSVSSRRLRPRPRSPEAMQNTIKQEDLSEDVGLDGELSRASKLRSKRLVSRTTRNLRSSLSQIKQDRDKMPSSKSPASIMPRPKRFTRSNRRVMTETEIGLVQTSPNKFNGMPNHIEIKQEPNEVGNIGYDQSIVPILSRKLRPRSVNTFTANLTIEPLSDSPNCSSSTKHSTKTGTIHKTESIISGSGHRNSAENNSSIRQPSLNTNNNQVDFCSDDEECDRSQVVESIQVDSDVEVVEIDQPSLNTNNQVDFCSDDEECDRSQVVKPTEVNYGIEVVENDIETVSICSSNDAKSTNNNLDIELHKTHNMVTDDNNTSYAMNGFNSEARPCDLADDAQLNQLVDSLLGIGGESLLEKVEQTLNASLCMSREVEYDDACVPTMNAGEDTVQLPAQEFLKLNTSSESAKESLVPARNTVSDGRELLAEMPNDSEQIADTTVNSWLQNQSYSSTINQMEESLLQLYDTDTPLVDNSTVQEYNVVVNQIAKIATLHPAFDLITDAIEDLLTAETEVESSDESDEVESSDESDEVDSTGEEEDRSLYSDRNPVRLVPARPQRPVPQRSVEINPFFLKSSRAARLGIVIVPRKRPRTWSKNSSDSWSPDEAERSSCSESSSEYNSDDYESDGIKKCDIDDINAGLYDITSWDGWDEFSSDSEGEITWEEIEDDETQQGYKGRIIMVKCPTGQLAKLRIDFLRPKSFPSEEARLHYDEAVARNARKLKSQIKEGSFTIEEYLENCKHILETQTRKQDEKLEHRKGKLKLVGWLKSEQRILEIDCLLKICLTLTQADVDKCLDLLDELGSTIIDPLMLKKHPCVVETIKRLRKYVGNTEQWKMSEEEAVHFKTKASLVRMKAETLYNKLRGLFCVPSNESFWTAFSKKVEEFRDVTNNLQLKEICHMVEDPTIVLCTDELKPAGNDDAVVPETDDCIDDATAAGEDENRPPAT